MSAKIKEKKIDLVAYWKGLTLGYMMLAWIVLVFFLRFKEWILIPALLVYLLVSAVVCNAYVIGMIGNMYYFLREPEKAKKFYTIAVKKNTRNVKALYNYALDALHEGRADEALPIFQRAEKLNVKVLFDKLIPLAVSSCYWVLGDIDKAISTIEDLQKKYNYINPNTLTTLGYFYMLKGNYEKAIELTNSALKDNQGDYKKAYENFQKAIDYRENMVESLYYMALLEENEGNIEKAKEYFEKAKGCYISALNTVKKEQIEEELKKLEK